MEQSNTNLEEFNISGNCINKNFTYFAKYAEILIKFLGNCSRMTTFKISHNNLRGSANGLVDKLLLCFNEMNSLKNLDLSSNILGRSYGAQQSKSPPICILASVLMSSQIQNLNIADNEMELKSAIAIAQGMKYSLTLKQINVSGNPIGQ